MNAKQHIQGFINHGRGITLFRTFNNIYNGTNLAVHTWLLGLEETYLSEGGKLPDTIYSQIDGGSENANVTMKGICELLVARRLTRKVVLTRLPVGHTHEDIDSVFGKIWKHIDSLAVFTPQGYDRVLRQAMAKRNVAVHVEDIFCLPDYKSYMAPYLDHKLTRCDKLDWTALQWTFEAVEPCDVYPSGVMVQYRKFTVEEVFLVKESESHSWGFDCDKYKVNTHPVPAAVGDPKGIYLMKSLPTGDREFFPQSFIKGSRKHFETLVRRISNDFKKVVGVAQEWQAWAANKAPLTDCANDYIKNQEALHVPFLDILFNDSHINTEQYIAPYVPKQKKDEPAAFETTNSVVWSNRGQPCTYFYFICC